MSYALRLAGDAIADLQALEVWLQEEVLDEAETLADDPALLRRIPHSAFVVHDFVREREGRRHYLFLSLHADFPRSKLNLLGVSHYSRPLT